MTFFFRSPSMPRNHIMTYSVSSKFYSLSLYSWFSINGLSTLPNHTPYFSLLASAHVTFLLIYTFRSGAAGGTRGPVQPPLKVRPL